MPESKRIVVAMTGSSGSILGIRLLQALRGSGLETHLVLSPSARLTISQETTWRVEDVLSLADVVHPHNDIGASIASGSFATRGMVIIPCSIKTLSAVANCYSADLISRAADVTLKEGRPLLLVVRETPLHRGHLRLMDLAARSGAVIFPPVPAFYAHPATVDEAVDGLVGRILARMGIENALFQEWGGVQPAAASETGLQELLALPALTLSTSGEDGQPHAAAVYFTALLRGEAKAGLPDPFQWTLYFFSDAQAQHAHDLALNPRAAAELHPAAAQGWQEIRGLQLRGSVRPVPPGAEWDAAFAAYLSKFPFVAGMQEIVAQNQLFAFTPVWLRWLDNRRGFGWKEESPSA